MEKKIVKIECEAHFSSTPGSYGVPELKMYVDGLIDNSMFVLEHGGRWSHCGAQLCSASQDLRVRGSRFAYEGEIHPAGGSVPLLDSTRNEASFYTNATISNIVTREEIDVILLFTANTKGVREIVHHHLKVEEFNQKKRNDESKADEIMAMLKS